MGYHTKKDGDPSDMGTKWSETYSCPSKLTQENFQVMVKGRVAQVESGGLLELKRHHWESRDIKAAGDHRIKYCKERLGETDRQTDRELQRPLASLRVFVEGNGNPLQYSCPENPMDRGAWWAAVHGVANSWTRLSDFTLLFTFMPRRRKWQPTPVFLPGESQGRGSLVSCRLWGRTELDTTEVT